MDMESLQAISRAIDAESLRMIAAEIDAASSGDKQVTYDTLGVGETCKVIREDNRVTYEIYKLGGGEPSDEAFDRFEVSVEREKEWDGVMEPAFSEPAPASAAGQLVIRLELSFGYGTWLSAQMIEVPGDDKQN